MPEPLTDREQLVAWQQAQQLEAQTVDHVLHYEALGLGLATFCQAMYDALYPATPDVPRFSREETLWLIAAAVQGR
jgi:hypothetical protein